MKPSERAGSLTLFWVCAGLWLCPSSVHLSAAKDAPAGRPLTLSRAQILRCLFEADVLSQLDARDRARELYRKADPSGACPERLVSALLASDGHGEKLFLDMETARKGDFSALKSTLDCLYLNEGVQPQDPSLALELYETAKRANPEGSIPGEAEIVDLLKMAAAAGPFDLEVFLTQHGLTKEEPYFLWKLAEEASVGGRFGKPDPQLVLQLVGRGPGSLRERLSAVRAAHTNWANKGGPKFESHAHISSSAAVEPAKGDEELTEEKREEMFQANFNRLEAVFKNPRTLSVDLREVPGVACSEDGKLRIVSWMIDTGGTMRLYCAMAQFKTPDGKAGYSLLAHPEVEGLGKTPIIWGNVSKIDTVPTNSEERVYLVWSSAKTSSRIMSESVTAVTLKNGKIARLPFFKTKRALLSQIAFDSGVWDEDERPAFQFSKENGYTLRVPVISDEDEFSGKFFKYVFDGKRFSYSGVQ